MYIEIKIVVYNTTTIQKWESIIVNYEQLGATLCVLSFFTNVQKLSQMNWRHCSRVRKPRFGKCTDRALIEIGLHAILNHIQCGNFFS